MACLKILMMKNVIKCRRTWPVDWIYKVEFQLWFAGPAAHSVSRPCFFITWIYRSSSPKPYTFFIINNFRHAIGDCYYITNYRSESASCLQIQNHTTYQLLAYLPEKIGKSLVLKSKNKGRVSCTSFNSFIQGEKKSNKIKKLIQIGKKNSISIDHLFLSPHFFFLPSFKTILLLSQIYHCLKIWPKLWTMA